MSSLITRLWSHARDALTRLTSSLFTLDTYAGKERRDLSRWIGAIESFVRRIVLVEALHLERGPSDPRFQRRGNVGPKPRSPKKRAPRLRLWPRPKRMPVRVTLLGRPTSMRELWREQRRAALIARLKAARGRRRCPHIMLADRIDALENILAAPMRAARRLARKLARAPGLAIRLNAARIRRAIGLKDDLLLEAKNAAYAPALNLNSS